MPKLGLDISRNLPNDPFPVVGIGASAGGLDAFKKVVKAIPKNSGMAYILVQHLHPGHDSALPEILQKETKIPVSEITDNVHVDPNHIYVIPSNKLLVAHEGVLKLSPRPVQDDPNKPIDLFFSSLAEVHQSNAIGVVLSGTGTDGTAGLTDIKSHGGITFAQDLDSAAYDGMPRNAIEAGTVDFILAPESIPQRLMVLKESFNIFSTENGYPSNELADHDSLKKIIALLRVRKGLDFSLYKQTTIRRRIIRRMVLLKLESSVDYAGYLRKSKPEQDLLFQDLLIPVTSFFRNQEVFDILCKTVIPTLVKSKSTYSPLRIWVAGCSTGQEAYSIAMCLHEGIGDLIPAMKVQIFASDASEKSIQKARKGLYLKKELEGVSSNRLTQFFNKTNDGYQVKKVIRDMCVFACHNFLKDPPFAKMDLISCRNVLIYLEPFLQKKALTTFHYALNEKGDLWLGKSETTGNASDLFIPLDKKYKFYAKKSVPERFMAIVSDRNETVFKNKNYSVQNQDGKTDDFQKSANEILLSKYTPVGVIVNELFDIVQFRGLTGKYLEHSSGKPSVNVIKMAREGLSFELRNALHRSKATSEPFIKEGIPINKGKRVVTIEIIPLLDTIDPYFLILFKETLLSSAHKDPSEADSPSSKDGKKGPEYLRIQQLEKEMEQLRENMRSITEDQETVNKELQSANEELLSSSEELQSLNEELETSKEELQSTNEELLTVNQELNDRNEQLSQSRQFGETIIATLHEPLLVLDQDFNIKNANNSFYKTFGLSEDETLGKKLFDLQDKAWNIHGLKKELLKIRKKKERMIELEIAHPFPSVGGRIIKFNVQLIYRENGEQLFLLALDDITERVLTENKIKESESKYHDLIHGLPIAVYTCDRKGYINLYNEAGVQLWGRKPNLGVDRWFGPLKIFKTDGKDLLPEEYPMAIALQKGHPMSAEIVIQRADGSKRNAISHAQPEYDSWGSIIGAVNTLLDITEQAIKEQKKDEFISIASHEMKTPLTMAKAYMQLLEESLDPANKEAILYAKKSRMSVERLQSLVSELLDTSKINHGKLDYNFYLFNFNEMLDSVIEGIQYTSKKHIIKTGTITKDVTGDKDRLQQVVVNLLSNAVKYSPGDENILVNVEQGKNEVKVSVTDRGIGLSKHNLEKIFEKYYRVADKEIAYSRGLGIGLYISFEIIQRHHGKIWAESELGKGSTFYFTLPLKS